MFRPRLLGKNDCLGSSDGYGMYYLLRCCTISKKIELYNERREERGKRREMNTYPCQSRQHTIHKSFPILQVWVRSMRLQERERVRLSRENESEREKACLF